MKAGNAALLALLAACSGTEGTKPTNPEQGQAPPGPHGPPNPGQAWSGPWTVKIYAPDPADPAAAELGLGLGQPVETWAGGRPRATRGEVAVVWVPISANLAELAHQLEGGGAPGADLVVVFAPGNREVTPLALDEWPWTGLGVVDTAASASLWVDPGVASDNPTVAGRVAARVLADRYGLTYTPTKAELPPGLDAWLGIPSSAGLTAADPRTRAATVLASAADWPIDALVTDSAVGVRLALAATTRDASVRARLAADADPQVRARAADGLDDVAVLTDLLDDRSSVVRVIATDRLARLAGARPADVAPALRTAAASTDAYQRWKAAWGLGYVPGGVDALLPLLKDPDIDVRREAARSLGRQRDRRAVEPLTVALSDTNSFVRRWAASALGVIGDPAAKDALRAAAKDPTTLVAKAAAESLSALGEPTPAPNYVRPKSPRDDAELRSWLTSPDATLRRDATKFCTGRPDAAALLTPLLSDADSEVRKCAVDVLGETPSAGPAVLPFLSDPDPDVVVTTLDALRREAAHVASAVATLRTHPDAEVRLRAAEVLGVAGPSDALLACLSDPDERVRAAAAAVYPERVSPTEPSALVRHAAGELTTGELRWWGAGTFAREDDLLHVRFSWNEDADRPNNHRNLRPPTIRQYGHPNRG